MGNFRLDRSTVNQTLPEKSKAKQIKQTLRRQKQTVRKPVNGLPSIFFDNQGNLDPHQVCPPTPPGWDSNEWYISCIYELGIEENYLNKGLI